jgi:predicted transcriptional regulator of viral defense system
LTNQIPKNIYLNFEQSKKKKPSNIYLHQKNIDFAFNRKPRTTNQVTVFDNYRVYLLNGMHTGNYGVIEKQNESNKTIYFTDLERTLVDIIVRPFYSGGIFEIAEAYKRAKGKLDIEYFVKTYKDLGYIYPYHQAIGFLMEKSGVYNPKDYEAFLRMPITNDFYLTHNIKNKEHSKKWRLFYPEGF